MIKEVFANGRLAPGTTDASPGVQKALRLAAELQIPGPLAIAAALQQPWKPRVLSVPSRPKSTLIWPAQISNFHHMWRKSWQVRAKNLSSTGQHGHNASGARPSAANPDGNSVTMT